MDKLFRQVSVKERLPEKSGRYFTSFGECTFSIHTRKWLFMLEDSTNYIDWYLEELELPNEEDIDKATVQYDTLNHSDTISEAFENGAQWALNTLKGEKSND